MSTKKAADFEILRGVKVSGTVGVPLEREPIAVATLIDEAEFNRGHLLKHNSTVFLEDRHHDWRWEKGMLYYYSRVVQVGDVVAIYRREDWDPRHSPETSAASLAAEHQPIESARERPRAG